MGLQGERVDILCVRIVGPKSHKPLPERPGQGH